MEQLRMFMSKASVPARQSLHSVATDEPQDLTGVVKFIDAVSAFAKAGYLQLVLVGISAAWLSLGFVLRRYARAPETKTKASSISLPWELTSQLTRAAAAGFMVAAVVRVYREHWVDAVPLVYAFVLGVLRLFHNLNWRRAALLQVNTVTVCAFLILVAGELLPLLLAYREARLSRMVSYSMIALGASVVVAICTPREWTPNPRVIEITEKEPEPSNEEVCSLVNKYWTFEWLTPLIWKGFKGDLVIDDLPKLPQYDEPLYLLSRIQDAREKGKTTLWTVLRFLRKELGLMIMWTAIAFTVDLVPPYALYQLLGYLADPKGSAIKPWAWLTLMFLGPITHSISFQQYIFTSTRLIVRLTAGLTQQLYYKAMTSMELEDDIFADKSDAKAKPGEVAKATSAGRLANLMSSDIDSIWQGRDMIMIGVGAPIGTFLTMFGLWKIMGWPSLAGAAVMALGTPIPIWLAQMMGGIQTDLKKAQDSRISLITEYLGSIRAVKYFAWEGSMVGKIDVARAKEQKLLWKIAILWVWLGEIIQVLPVIAMLVMFTLHVAVLKQKLTAATAFTTITLLSNLTRNLGMTSVIARYVTGAYVSVKRLEKYFASVTPLTQYPAGPLRVESATFRRNRKAVFTLKDISIDFVEGGLNVVTGQSGSGKTTLLLSILGETVVESGSVTRPRDVAFASQTSWLQNESVKDNIVFNAPLDEARYDSVVDACCLNQDLAELAKGDQTQVGENGTSLSGGQKARVALARALYSHAPLLVLDDIFSALDTKTSASLWRRCFCTDLLKDRTVVLVAQHPWIAAQADLVIKMENGEVVGAEQNLGVVRRPVLLSVESETVVANNDAAAGSANGANGNGTEAAEGVEDGAKKKPADDAKPAAKDEVSDEMEASGKAARLMWLNYMGFFGNPAYAFLTLLTLVAYNVVILAAGFWLSIWVNAYEYEDAVDIAFYLGIYVALCLGELVIDGVVFLAFENGGWLAAKKLHEQCIRSVMGVGLPWFNKVPVGRIVNRFSRDMNSLDTSLPQMLRYFLGCCVALVLQIGAVSSIMPVFMIPAAFTCLFGIVAGEMYTRTAVVVKRLVSSSRSPVFSQFSDSLAGLAVIRAREHMPKVFGDRLAERLRAFSRASQANYNCNRWVAVRVDFVTALVSFCAGLIAISKAGVVAAGLVGFSLSNATYLSGTILGLVRTMNEVEVELQCFYRVREYADLEPEEKAEETKKLEENSEGAGYVDDEERSVPKNWPRSGSVEFRDVTIRYDPEGPDILTDVNLTFRAGERVAVVGRTGSGKSTLVLSMLRFTHIVKGRILYDGVDITAIPRHRLRSSLTIIPQEAVLFNGDVESNLDPTGLLPKDTLQRALDSCSGIASFEHHDSGTATPAAAAPSEEEPGASTSSSSSDGNTAVDLSDPATVAGVVAAKVAAASGITLGTVVDPKGENFSHGQRQVLSLCRALVRGSKLMLLDEATASMDYKTDKGIQEVLREEMHMGRPEGAAAGRDERTLVTIAHRLRTIVDYDKVVVMGGGKVLEFGSPKELLESKGQFYDMLHHSGEFEELLELIGA